MNTTVKRLRMRTLSLLGGVLSGCQYEIYLTRVTKITQASGFSKNFIGVAQNRKVNQQDTRA